MPRRLALVASISLLGFLASCASTRLLSSWRNPSVESVSFERVLAVAVVASEAERRRTEDEMVRAIGERGVASYTLFPGDPNTLERESARREVAEAGFDGAVVLRKISAETQVTYWPGTAYYVPYYAHFWGYWTYAWPVAYEPGYLASDVVVKFETLVYDLEADELVWAGQSEAVNPSSLANLVPELAQQVTREMRREGLLS